MSQSFDVNIWGRFILLILFVFFSFSTFSSPSKADNHSKTLSEDSHLVEISNNHPKIVSKEDSDTPDKASVVNTFVLSEQEVLEKVLSSSPFIQKLELQKQKGLSQILEEKSSLSQGTFISKFSRSGKRDFSSTGGKYKSQSNIDLGFQKKLPLGLTIKPVYSTPIGKSNTQDSLQSKNLGLEFSAQLSEAVTQFWALSSIEREKQINQWLYYEMAEELALQSIVQYWKAYLAWISYAQSLESLKTYDRLVQQVNNKQQYSFLKPGERPQVLAEYENIKQEADKRRQNYESEKGKLLLFLKKDPNHHDIQFAEAKLIPPPNEIQNINIENTRSIKIKEQQLKAQDLKLKTSKVGLFPSLQFYTKGGMVPPFKNHRLSYEFGVSMKWSLFSRSFYEKIQQEKYTLEENKIDFEISKQSLKNQLSSLIKEILIGYKNAERAEKSNIYQKQAFQQLKNSFEQGRVDIFELILVENKLRASEIKRKEAISKYSILILQLLALKDELVEKYIKP